MRRHGGKGEASRALFGAESARKKAHERACLDIIPYGVLYYRSCKQFMHTIREKQKLIARIRRIRGQVEAVEKALGEARGCYGVWQNVTAAPGALNAPVPELSEDRGRAP